MSRLPLRAWLLFALLVAIAVSAIGVRYPRDFVVEHALTLVAVAALIAIDRRAPLSNLSYGLILAFMLLHVLGAHYTYSLVPYDSWCESLFGRGLSETLGAISYEPSGEPRNHFDRLVHFSFGLLLVQPASELMQRWLGLRGIRAVLAAIGFLCVVGTLYELAEWRYADIAGAEAAAHYNGQQGDAFDAQKDLSLSLAGSLIGAAAMGLAALFRGGRRT